MTFLDISTFLGNRRGLQPVYLGTSNFMFIDGNTFHIFEFFFTAHRSSSLPECPNNYVGLQDSIGHKHRLTINIIFI